MRTLFANWKAQRSTPLRAMKWILVVQTFLGGSYIISPLVKDAVANIIGTSVITTAVASPLGIWLLGSIFLLSGAVLAAGLVQDKLNWIALGLFVNILVRIYGIVVGWLINGFFPPTWLASLTLLAIVVVLYIQTKKEQKGNAHSNN